MTATLFIATTVRALVEVVACERRSYFDARFLTISKAINSSNYLQ